MIIVIPMVFMFMVVMVVMVMVLMYIELMLMLIVPLQHIKPFTEETVAETIGLLQCSWSADFCYGFKSNLHF